ncbi:hypothetical protein ACGFZL_00850 [Streptomyces sp. NPDC048182]|uniref:hypothetical protein n=1 Tax=Streptomyces sp. NPDC048182 TaxID=3365507 RepID=UPI003713A03C
MEVAAVTFANGSDNIGVYVPVFATAGIGGMSLYAVVFLVLLARWGHILLPVVLIGIGLLILIEGGAFGL